MNTHLKGRIVKAAGTSYLILHEESPSAEWLRIKALNGCRTVHWVHRDMFRRELAAIRPAAALSA